MLHTITCLYARNNNKVTSRRQVEFEIFTKLGIFGPLGPPTGQIYGAIGPVFELSRRLTHILLSAKYQIDGEPKSCNGALNIQVLPRKIKVLNPSIQTSLRHRS